MTAKGPAATTPRALHHAARAWIIGTGVALVLVIAGLIIANIVFQRRMVRDIENDRLTVTTQRRLVDWAIAVHETSLADEVVRLARSADLKEAIALGGRDPLLDVQEDAGRHASAGLPLVARGQVRGVLSLLFTERREFTTEDKELMMLLADSVAIALEGSRAAEASSPVT